MIEYKISWQDTDGGGGGGGGWLVTYCNTSPSLSTEAQSTAGPPRSPRSPRARDLPFDQLSPSAIRFHVARYLL